VGDVVIVEGEWGRIEEITLTYVVVHLWDDRRLVLPLSYFIEKPFQNWTRTSSELLGSVFVWVDYTFPVEEGRAALKEIIEASSRWDKRFWNLQRFPVDATIHLDTTDGLGASFQPQRFVGYTSPYIELGNKRHKVRYR
jgi:hypothetical protein